MSFVSEFKRFAIKGNVVDMAAVVSSSVLQLVKSSRP
jgi:large-conductance mechanosensitive channel